MEKNRFDWALSLLKPGPADAILEIGCGAGLLAERMAATFTTGSLTAIDKSQPMIHAALKRNRIFVDQGRVRFYVQDYNSVEFEAQSFDKIVAFNLGVFWQKPGRYLPLVSRHLKPKGLLYLFYQPPFNKTASLVQAAEAALRNSGFRIKESLVENGFSVPAFCIIATPGAK